MIGFELTRPWMLGVLLLAAPVVVYLFVHSLSDFPRAQRIVSLVMRLGILTLLAFALAGLNLLHWTHDRYVVFLTDQSTSIDESAAAVAVEYFDRVARDTGKHRYAFLPFAARPGRVQVTVPQYGDRPSILGLSGDDSELPAAETTGHDSQNDIQDGTDLAAAMAAAAGFLPPGYVHDMVMLSDGVQTEGDGLAAAKQSRAPVSTVLLPSRAAPEVQVSDVSVPAEVREGEPFYVEVHIDSNHDDEGWIEVFRGDHRVISESKPIKSGENRFRFEQSIDRERLAEFSVRISQLQHDTLLDNNTRSGLVYSAGKPRVLLIESDPTLIRDLAYSLEDEGIQVDLRPPQGVPETLADLQNYELVIVSNVPATALTHQQMNVLRTYVQELGGGFLMLGGEQSFGLGGYYKSALEEILPVRSDFEKETEKPSLAMVLVIDKSGSMDGDKIELAKSAARGAVELLGRRDQVAVLAFDGETFVVSEMQTASNKDQISGEIARIDAGGGTTMYPAMETAYDLLAATNARLKHVIVLTDGISSPGDFEGLAQQMASQRMTVSTVAVGAEADVNLLEAIARVGKGRYYFTEDPSQVPQIFARETVTASKSAIDEQPFLPQVTRSTYALSGIDLQSAPFLLGYVMTRPKPTCEVILATEKGDPLLAWWRYGLGMTGAFTSDAKNRWAAEWITWPGFGKFWTQVVRQLMRKNDASGIAVDVVRNGSVAEVHVDAVDAFGQFLNDADVELTVIDPLLRQERSALTQIAPGRYATEIRADRPGAYHMEIAVKQKEQVLYRQSRGMAVGYSNELRIQPANEELLRMIAETSGGSFAPDPASLLTEDERRVTRPTPLHGWLVAIASLLWVLDVLLRRVDFGRHWPFNRLTAPQRRLARETSQHELV